MSNNSSNKPVLTLKDGFLKVTIWRNEGENGPFYSTDLTRTYKDAGGNFKNTQGFSKRQLLQGQRLLDKAYDQISAFEEQDRASAPAPEVG